MINQIEYSAFKNSLEAADAMQNNEFIGFIEDYTIIHCLLKKWKPSSIFEIGTSLGNGCRVMNHACPSAKIITLDIKACGNNCPNTVTKVVADSMEYDYSQHYPIDCWFIDGNHVYENVFHETLEAIKSQARYIIYHDADIPEVLEAIKDGFKDHNQYILYQVINPPHIYSSTGKPVTRIVFVEKND